MLPLQGPAAQVPPREELSGKQAGPLPHPESSPYPSPQEQILQIHSWDSQIDNRLQEHTALVAKGSVMSTQCSNQEVTLPEVLAGKDYQSGERNWGTDMLK